MTSLLDILRESAVEYAPIKEPSNKWRNIWDFEREVQYYNGVVKGPGLEFGDLMHPSKEVAEEMAYKYVKKHENAGDGISYVGAVEVKE